MLKKLRITKDGRRRIVIDVGQPENAKIDYDLATLKGQYSELTGQFRQVRKLLDFAGDEKPIVERATRHVRSIHAVELPPELRASFEEIVDLARSVERSGPSIEDTGVFKNKLGSIIDDLEHYEDDPQTA